MTRGKSNKNVPPAAPGRSFKTLFDGIKYAPAAPAGGRPLSVMKRSASVPQAVGKRSRTGLSTSFRERAGTGDTSGSPVLMDAGIDDAAVSDNNVDGACGVEDGVRSPRDWALVNAGQSCLLLLWIQDGLNKFEAAELQIIDLAGISESLSSKRVRCLICAPLKKFPTP
jgi:hypothetical protein